ncbi:hypothetical protein BCR33DRAFT_780100 [Rhizoclosmatium globosum]|uniref:Uncharacterized protein n=1 Tax=Rhizoclosmatium globosum TaxID=329046 RepID=A0A1Y2CY41_9FUNG|nr:hypothetical protein BCR33DRAFT_780100 [Rhizoclosmatium globosum]|eukprot:ORY51948.1 hypothetical protein BCR33DRAFT_780100 [Rhizoclosmatium globosum]
MDLLQQIQQAQQEFLSGNTAASHAHMQQVIAHVGAVGQRGAGNDTLLRLSAVLLLKTAPVSEAAQVWRSVTRLFLGDFSAIPAAVAAAGMLAFVAAGDASAAESIFTSWICSQQEIRNDRSYVDLVHVYLRHVVCASQNYHQAREYIDLNDSLSLPQKADFLALIQQLEDDARRPPQPPISLQKPEVETSLDSKSVKEVVETGSTVFPNDNSKPHLKQNHHHDGKSKASTQPLAEPAKSTMQEKPSNVPPKTSPSLAATQPVPNSKSSAKLNLKLLVQIIHRQRNGILSILAAFLAFLTYKYREGSTVKSMIQILQRFMRTLQMASSF